MASPASSESELEAAFLRLKSAYRSEPYPAYEQRRQWLNSLERLLSENEDSICSAISADFGSRSRSEIQLAELFTSSVEVRHCLRHLRSWMRPRRVSTPWYMLPARAYVIAQPVGVVGVISPWNYPIFLSIPAAAGALAAGNRVLLKPSEMTPRTSELLQTLVARYFAPDVFTLVTGGPEIGKAVTRLPLDHLFFTGSTAVGREVARAAAENLTPTTLELGGKSPAVLGRGANLERAARSIVVSKLLNAGQTCIAPDYCFVREEQVEEFTQRLLRQERAMFSDEYTSIVSARHFDRLQSMLAEAVQAGARVLPSPPDSPETRSMPLKVVLNPPRDSRLMREEIFGPILPILTYRSIEEVVAHVSAGERPLALYYMGSDSAERRRLLHETVAGDVTVNDTLWHIAHPNLPFGGSGNSGQGAYHGEWSFRRFSHEKGVYQQSRWTAAPLLYPPFGKMFRATLGLLRRLH